jgi:hypothetical protein
MLERLMQVVVVEAVSIGLVDEAKGAAVGGHDDIWYVPPILPSPRLRPREAIRQDIKGFLIMPGEG